MALLVHAIILAVTSIGGGIAALRLGIGAGRLLEEVEGSAGPGRNAGPDRLGARPDVGPCQGLDEPPAPAGGSCERRNAAAYLMRPWAFSQVLATSPTSFWFTATSTPSFVSSSVVSFADAASSSAAKAVLSTLAR